MVVFFHDKSQLNSNPFFKAGDFLFSNGNSGVDIFFVISGFIMTYTAGSKSGFQASMRFILNRLTRIVPLYLLATVVFFLILHSYTWFLVPANILSFLKDMLFLPTALDKDPPFYGYPMLFVGWTLRYEMFFYLIFGLSLLFGRFKWIFSYSVFSILLVFIPLATHQVRLFSTTATQYHPAILNMLTNPIIAEFLAGMIIGQIYTSAIRLPRPASLAILGLGVVSFIAQYFGDWLPGHGLAGWGLFSTLFVFSLVMLHKEQPLQAPRWMVFLGDISYSIYLIHTVVAVTFLFAARRLHLPDFSDHFFYAPFYIAALVGICYLTYEYIEQRLSNFIKFQLFKILHL